MNIAQSKPMTNTPMTNKSLYEIFTEITGTVLVNGNEYHEVTQQELEKFMDSVYAQQSQTIAELVEALKHYENDVTYDDDILGLRVIKSGEVARQAIAKVKGK